MKHPSSTIAWRLIAASALAAPLFACTMPLPEPEPEDPPHEIECRPLGLNASGKLEYLVAIEISIMAPTVTTACMCGMNVGTGLLPASFNVTTASIAVVDGSTGDFTNIDAFDAFKESAEVARELAADDDALDNTEPSGFVMDVDPFEPPVLEPGDKEKMFFIVEFAPSDYALVNGQAVQFGAGSDDPSHPLQVFLGYQSALVLPPLVIGDVDFDGKVDASDLAQVLGSWGSCAIDCFADVTQDGIIDGNDLAVVLGAWAP